MKKYRVIAFTSLLAALFTAPATALASSTWHTNSDDVGITYHPDHTPDTKTRLDVLRELEAAKADGSLYYLQRALPVPSRNMGPGKSREQVIQELKDLTPDEREKMRELYSGG